MAAAHWHLLIGRKVLDALREGKTTPSGAPYLDSHPHLFMAGLQGPDVHFYPGGDDRIAAFAHGDQAAVLGKTMLQRAETDRQKAYAVGWWMHLIADEITHDFVDATVHKRLACNGDTEREGAAHPLGHHRVEWGVDVFILDDFSLAAQIPNVFSVLAQARSQAQFVAAAFRQAGGPTFTEIIWLRGVEGMIKHITLFYRLWKIAGILPAREGGLGRGWYRAVVLPFLHLAAIRKPQLGVFMPLLPPAEDRERVLAYTEKARDACLSWLADALLGKG